MRFTKRPFQKTAHQPCLPAWQLLMVRSLASPIHFLRFEDVRTVRQSYVNPLADRVWIFTFKRQNIGQQSLHARVGHRASPFCPLPSNPHYRLSGHTEVLSYLGHRNIQHTVQVLAYNVPRPSIRQSGLNKHIPAGTADGVVSLKRISAGFIPAGAHRQDHSMAPRRPRDRVYVRRSGSATPELLKWSPAMWAHYPHPVDNFPLAAELIAT